MVRKQPRWFKDLLAAERSRFYQREVGEAEAAQNLAALILANPDQRFAASIIASHVRPQIDPRYVASPKDGRASRAAGLRAEGLSLRQTAEKLGVSFATVRNDLKRWDAERTNVAELCTPPVQSRPEITQPGDTAATVIEFRRTS